MKKIVVFSLILISLTFSKSVDYYREFSVVDFFETISIYQHYITQHNANVAYGTGGSLIILGLGQSSTDTLITGVSYIGLGLLNQLNIIENDYKKRFNQYRDKIYATRSIPEMNALAAEALKQLIEKEKNDSLWNGGMMCVNGTLLALNPIGKGALAGVLMMLYGGYLAFVEKGPIESIVQEYKILDYEDNEIDYIFEKVNTESVIIEER